MPKIVVKNGYQNDARYVEIGLCAPNASTILSSRSHQMPKRIDSTKVSMETCVWKLNIIDHTMYILYIKVIYKIGDILVQSIEILHYQANKTQLPRLGCTYLQDLDSS